jgi:2-polyprenyl-3-methyl-5-hydroxy-6-metoxy-1,4-benzoquinol methylase
VLHERDERSMAGEAQGPAEVREADHWDRVVDRVGVEALTQEPDVQDRTAARRLDLLGPLAGVRLLDVGCGTGAWALRLAREGAEVWAIDISPLSIEATRRRAALHGLEERVHAQVMSATVLEFEDDAFDRIHGQDIIHHVEPGRFGREIARVLAPAGAAVFVENCANNRLLMLARAHLCGRWHIPKWRSEDEYPLTGEKRAQFCAHFGAFQVEYPTFVFFHLLDAYLFRFKCRSITHVSTAIDAAIHRCLPCLRRYSYRQLICCRAPLKAGRLLRE